jgi:hypothetical protein
MKGPLWQLNFVSYAQQVHAINTGKSEASCPLPMFPHNDVFGGHAIQLADLTCLPSQQWPFPRLLLSYLVFPSEHDQFSVKVPMSALT